MKRETAASLWSACLAEIEGKVSQKEYATWFSPTRGLSMDGKTLTVEIPNRIFYQWIEQNYAEQLRQALDTVLGSDARLRYSLPNVEKPGGSGQSAGALLLAAQCILYV